MNFEQLKYVCDEKSGGWMLFAGFERKQSSLRFVQLDHHGTMLYFFVIWDDQHRNTNMNNKDHQVGQLTSTAVLSWLACCWTKPTRKES